MGRLTDSLTRQMTVVFKGKTVLNSGCYKFYHGLVSLSGAKMSHSGDEFRHESIWHNI
jgi:hypothetical protein